MSYTPKMPFTVPALILKCEYRKVNGINTKTLTEGDRINVSARSYGGTERVLNDKVVIEDTIEIETWYRPDIKSKDCIRLLDDGSVWEIINHPEDIDRRHQYLKFKIQRKKGGA